MDPNYQKWVKNGSRIGPGYQKWVGNRLEMGPDAQKWIKDGQVIRNGLGMDQKRPDHQKWIRNGSRLSKNSQITKNGSEMGSNQMDSDYQKLSAMGPNLQKWRSDIL